MKTKSRSEEFHPQYQKIIDKFREKYKNPIDMSKLKHLLTAKVEGLTPQLIMQILSKLFSFINEKNDLTDDHLKVALLITCAAQRNIPIKEMELNSFSKYKQKSLKLKVKQQASREEQKTKSPETQTTTKQQLKQQIKEQKVLIESNQKQEVAVTQKQVQQQPPRKLSFGKDNEYSFGNYEQYDVSISTKLTPQNVSHHNLVIECDKQPIQELPEISQTPKFIKGNSETSRFHESQLQMEPKLKSKPSWQKIEITIRKAQKKTEGWSSFIKYEIKTENKNHPPVWRRYSQFVRLQFYLKETYKGIIIPELPPKEQIKNAFWDTDINTINERKVGLQQFLNKVLSHETLGKDRVLLRFIDDETLPDTAYNQESLMTTAEKYLSTLLNITSSTEQLKDYGFAYFSFLKSYKSEEEDTEIEELNSGINGQLTKLNLLKAYVEKIETIHQKRIRIEIEYSIDRNTKFRSFLKEIDKIQVEFMEAKSAYDDFCKLKTQKKWIQLLYETKKSKNTSEEAALGEELNELSDKITKVMPILKREMQEFIKSKQQMWGGLYAGIRKWHVEMTKHKLAVQL